MRSLTAVSRGSRSAGTPRPSPVTDPDEQSMLLGALIGMSAASLAVAGAFIWWLHWLKT